ncbi:MAG: twin-arginine translocase TatA/TatE family subunit [Deltaproteobacteria bacterium]|jgi:sec-independent protein translocase protein TatA|nr:twin-arginine translocase TatA/TatE family subunit [Deltaproteobacteria bacterium]MBW2173257.1 twin-arginine translocase TatA/TatE family subunit [Deltaproteobacteria bacterium]MBW2566597.1 twin-arginine translocase TatA/TatE family subunit [Deltaproteobacteria bacterium]
MFGLGVPELLIIALLILLFFGAKRLPGIGTGLGKTVKEIRDIKKDMSSDKEPGKETESAEDPGPKKKSLEGKLAEKVIDRVPGIGQVKKLKDKAEKIKKFVS